MGKPLIVGMNNPLSQDPRYALYPLPARCAGNRLYEMLRAECPTPVTMRDYVRRFDRVNLVTGPWNAGEARKSAARIISDLAGRRVVLLGRAVATAFRFFSSIDILAEWVNLDDEIKYYLLPHPSGRNLRYNDPDVRKAAGRILAELYEGGDS